MDLLQPLQLTRETLDAYVNLIHNRTLEQLQDDLQMIWIQAPAQGYGDLKPLVLELRAVIIKEMKNRKPVPWRERLVHRLPKSQD